MIDWCKSNKNIALFITLSSKDSVACMNNAG